MRKKQTDKTKRGKVVSFPGSHRPTPPLAKGKKHDFKHILMAQAMDDMMPFEEFEEDGIPLFHKVLFNDATEFLLNLNVSLKTCLYLDSEAIPSKLEFTAPVAEADRMTGALYHTTYPDGTDGIVYDYEMEGFFQELLPLIILDLHNRFEEYEARYADELAEDGDFRIAMALIGATRTDMFQHTEEIAPNLEF